MPRETLFFAQSFRASGRKVIASTPEKFRSRELAIAAATRMLAVKAGAIAFEVTGDPEGGEYDEPIFLFKEGLIPRELRERE